MLFEEDKNKKPNLNKDHEEEYDKGTLF